MPSERTPARDVYDALITPFPWEGPARSAIAIVKQSFTVDRGVATAAPALPLLHDLRDASSRRAHARGSDYPPMKPGADIVVLGAGYPSAQSADVSLQVGHVQKTARLFGRRIFRLAPSARIEHIDGPEPTPLTREEAFGGGRPRTDRERRVNAVLRHLAARTAGHSNLYPRNPYGTGFFDEEAAASPDFAVELPRLENPADLLSVERLAALHLRPWWEAPLPWHFDAMGLDQFPRSPLSPPSEMPDAGLLSEVTQGLWPAAWLTLGVEALEVAAPFRESALGLLGPSTGWEGAPVELLGMLPEGEPLRFTLPGAPRIGIGLEGEVALAEPRLTQLVLRPDERSFTMTWVAFRTGLPRAFVPGLHGVIPLSLHVETDAPLHYEAPPTIRALRQAHEASSAAPRPIEGALDLAVPSSGSPRRERDVVPIERAPMAGDIDAATGRLLLVETDYVLPGVANFALTRHYSSSMGWRVGALGRGWSHPLEEAAWHEDGQLLYRAADGRELRLPVSGGELSVYASTHHPVDGVTIARSAPEAFDVWHEDGRHTRLELVPATVQVGPVRARPTRIFGLDGVELRVRYDAHGRLARLDWADGRGLRFEHDDAGRLVRVFAPTASGDFALAARYEFDRSGQLRAVHDGAGARTRYRYAGGAITEQILPNGLRRQFRYDAEGERCVAEVVDESGKTRLVQRGGSTVRVADAEGHWRSWVLDEAHRPVLVRDPFGRATHLRYDATSGLLSERSVDGATASLLYDANDHLADFAAPDAGSVAAEHDALGRLTSVCDADGAARRWRWDEAGRLAAATLASGATEVFSYGQDGRLTSVRLPTELEAQLERDEAGGVVSIRASTGLRYATRDALGRVASFTDEAGSTRRLAYEPTGRLAKVEHPMELEERFITDTEGHVVERRRPLEHVICARDDHGRTIEIGDGETSLRLHRDGEGRVTLVESEADTFWEIERDAAGRAHRESRFDGSTRVYIRGDGGLIKRAIVGITRTDVARDRQGRPLAYEHGDHTFQRLAWSPGGRLRRAQDADHVLELAHDGLGRLLFERSDGASVESTHGSTARTQLSSSSGLVSRWERDGLGRTSGLSAGLGEQRLSVSIQRDLAGRERRRSLPGGLTLALERDALGRVVQRSVEHSGRSLAALRFEYAGLTRLAKVIEPGRGARHASYDGRGRLLGLGAQRRALGVTGSVSTGETTHGDNGQVLEAAGSTYRYDHAGRRIEREDALGERVTYRWDDGGRLVGVDLSESLRIEYRYDALGRCVERRREERVHIEGLDEPVWDTAATSTFVWDGVTLLHEVDDGALSTWLWDGGELWGCLSPEGPRAMLLDPFGRPTEMVDAEGNVVWKGAIDLFGHAAIELEQARCPWRMPGYREDPDTGLLHSWSRVFDPEVGAHLSPSPLGVAGGSNLYSGLGDPLLERSPLGLGRGLVATRGALGPEGLEAERFVRCLSQLDRGDGAAGRRARFDVQAAELRLPDVEALFYGPWASARPSVRRPGPAWQLVEERPPVF